MKITSLFSLAMLSFLVLGGAGCQMPGQQESPDTAGQQQDQGLRQEQNQMQQEEETEPMMETDQMRQDQQNQEGTNMGMDAETDSPGDTGMEMETEVDTDQEEDNRVQEEPMTEVKSFDVTAMQWEFEPGTIRVNKGDTVRLNITSEDVQHGFSLPAFGVDETLQPGETVNVEFVADKAGTHTFFCNVFCGAGHSDMNGSLIVG